VYDVGWSPIHPALFASVDGTGILSLWNLINDHETAYASQTLNEGLYALNKLKWSHCGLRIACGNDNGRLSILDVNENIAKSKPDDNDLFRNCVNEMNEKYAQLNATDGTNDRLYF
jgi:dynein intermediate chain